MLKAILLHMSKVQSAHVNWVTGWCIVELIWCIFELLPIAKNWSFRSLLTNQIFPHNNNANSSWSNIFLSTCIDNAILFPLNRATAHIRAHITNKSLITYQFIRELLKLNSMDSFIIAIVEVTSVFINIPIRSFWDGVELIT
jgi:hypothetical protein